MPKGFLHNMMRKTAASSNYCHLSITCRLMVYYCFKVSIENNSNHDAEFMSRSRANYAMKTQQLIGEYMIQHQAQRPIEAH